MKWPLLLIFFSCLTVQIYSQDFGFGVKGGLNLSTVTGDVPNTVNPRLAYHFGGFAYIPLSDRFSLNPELLYLSIGNTDSFNTENFDAFNPVLNTSVESVSRANFFAVPVNIRYHFTKRFGLDFGPQISFLLNSLDKVKETEAIDPIFVENRRTSGNFRPDYGANIGLTFLPIDKLSIQLRYYQGLKNLNRSQIFNERGSFNVALQLSVGYIIF